MIRHENTNNQPETQGYIDTVTFSEFERGKFSCTEPDDLYTDPSET